MTLTSAINIFFRLAQLVPLILVLIPIVHSYWQKRNQINGLRRVRVALIILISSLIFSNLYFIFFSYLNISRASFLGICILLADKIVNLASYFILYWLFKHATDHGKDLDKQIVGLKEGIKNGR